MNQGYVNSIKAISCFCSVCREFECDFQTRWHDDRDQHRQKARATQTTHESAYRHTTDYTTHKNPNSLPWQVSALLSFNKKNMLKVYFAPTHKHLQTYRHLYIQSPGIWDLQLIVFSVYSPQTDREKDPDYDSLPSQTSQSESSMLQVICRPEATNKEEAYTFHTVHSKQVWRIYLGSLGQ